jgi:hypothetical protein
MPSEIVIDWINPERTRRVIIERAPSGLFCWYEEHFIVDDETAEGGGIYEYWSARNVSGLYPSVLDAQNDAANQLGWLRLQIER